MFKFLLLINKQGQQRIVKYYQHIEDSQKKAQEVEIIRTVLLRNEQELLQELEEIPSINETSVLESHNELNDLPCNFFDFKGCKVIYRKYATLYFIIGTDNDENELAVFEFIRNIVETFDKYFDKVCELDIMFNLDRCHMILDEMVLNGKIVESNKSKVLAPLQLMDQALAK